jgi:septal ring factor EnvC (AmiA/AmiB activator)
MPSEVEIAEVKRMIRNRQQSIRRARTYIRWREGKIEACQREIATLRDQLQNLNGKALPRQRPSEVVEEFLRSLDASGGQGGPTSE